jgi:hypothetical protein
MRKKIFLVVLRIKPRVSHMIGKLYNPELSPSLGKPTIKKRYPS